MHKIHCSACGAGSLKRIQREGIIEKFLLPVAGFYPWFCRTCKNRQLMRDRGDNKSALQEAR